MIVNWPKNKMITLAKLVGGYMKLEGGVPACALTYLSGGIATTDDITSTLDDPGVIDEMRSRNIFQYLESIEKDSLIAASNMNNDPLEEDNGLIAGHAYSVEDFEG